MHRAGGKTGRGRQMMQRADHGDMANKSSILRQVPISMVMRAWQFKPRLMPTIAVLILLPVLLALGFWQLDRAAQKSALYGQYVQRSNMPSVSLNTALAIGKNPKDLLWRRTTISGVYASDHQFLLDNQVLDGRAGYFIFTPFRLDGTGAYVLVNRGWLPANPDRTRIPALSTPSGAMRLDGFIKEPPITGIALSEDMYEDLAQGIMRVQKIDLDAIVRRSGRPLLPVIIRLEPGAASGFVRRWRDPGSGREKHLGYAFQWFLMGAVLIIVYIALNLKKTPQTHA